MDHKIDFHKPYWRLSAVLASIACVLILSDIVWAVVRGEDIPEYLENAGRVVQLLWFVHLLYCVNREGVTLRDMAIAFSGCAVPLVVGFALSILVVALICHFAR